MDLLDLKKMTILERFEMDPAVLGHVISFVDFGNVNYWFENDRQDHLNRALKEDEKFRIDLQALKDFADLISEDARFYYGHDVRKQGSLDFIRVAREIFGKHRVITKQIQYVRHHLTREESVLNTRHADVDNDGPYILIPKCNFDVEIAVEAVRLSDRFDTFCLFSSDADFAYLIDFLKKKGKKTILIKGGHITRHLKESVDLLINAQNIKEYIARIVKQRPDGESGLADRIPVSTGRTTRRS